MNREYIVPEIETIKFSVKDVILASITEATIPEVIGGDGGGNEDPIILDDL